MSSPEALPQSTGLSTETKEKRRAEAALDPRLKDRRFILAQDPALRQKLEKLDPVVKNLQKQFPFFFGVNIFGSHVRSYAVTESDFDLVLLFDSSVEFHTKRAEIETAVREALGEALNATYFATDARSATFFITEKKMRNVARSENYLDTHYGLQVVPCLFFLSVGNAATPYRRAVLETFKKMGSEGERRWRCVMQYVWEKENDGWPEDLKQTRRKLYPWTLDEALKYYRIPQKGILPTLRNLKLGKESKK